MRPWMHGKCVKDDSAGQTTENQIREIVAAGFGIEPHRVVEETISGSSAASQREGFTRLLDRLERGVLVVSKLDRLGRDVIDDVTTVISGRRSACLQLGGTDLTSAAGAMTMNVLAASRSSSAIY
jgi:putative DNA-invertase from lambdoid prophage Rac